MKILFPGQLGMLPARSAKPPSKIVHYVWFYQRGKSGRAWWGKVFERTLCGRKVREGNIAHLEPKLTCQRCINSSSERISDYEKCAIKGYKSFLTRELLREKVPYIKATVIGMLVA